MGVLQHFGVGLALKDALQKTQLLIVGDVLNTRVIR
jgi:hypothetical protein